MVTESHAFPVLELVGTHFIDFSIGVHLPIFSLSCTPFLDWGLSQLCGGSVMARFREEAGVSVNAILSMNDLEGVQYPGFYKPSGRGQGRGIRVWKCDMGVYKITAR